jgi:hypothetical protein
MNRKFLVAILTVAMFSSEVVFGVHIMYKDAWATNAAVQLNLDWNGFDSCDNDAIAYLINVDGDVLDTKPLTPNGSYTVWTSTFLGISVTEAVAVRFDWDVAVCPGNPEACWEGGGPPVEVNGSWPLITEFSTVAH